MLNHQKSSKFIASCGLQLCIRMESRRM